MYSVILPFYIFLWMYNFILFFPLVLVFQDRISSVAVLKLALFTRVALNSQRSTHLCLLSTELQA